MKFLKASNRFTEEQLSRIHYAAASIANDVTKIILYLFLGYICHKTRFVLGFLVAMLALRPLIGGIHCQTYWGCFLFSLGLIIVGLVINENGKDHIVLIEILNTMLFFQAIKLGPAVSPVKRKQTDKAFLVLAVSDFQKGGIWNWATDRIYHGTWTSCVSRSQIKTTKRRMR